MATVSVRDVHKSFGAAMAVRGVSLEIGDGEFVVLVGPSGCGKSTLLRVLAGLEDASRGSVWIDGEDITRAAPKDRDVAMVFQSYALYPHMTVEDNLGFGLRMRGVPHEELSRRVHSTARSLGLDGLLARRPRELSGGQRQRVAMGRAIVRDPKVFLFDEPLSNLDAKLRVDMRTEIKALQQRLRTTSVYVTHDQVEAMTLADRIVVMRDGVLEQAGAPLQVYDHPGNAFVATFIGSPAMNLLAGRLRQSEVSSRVVLDPADAGVEVPLDVRSACAEGTAVLLGVRPEHLELCGADTPLAGVVRVVEPTGAQTQVVVDTPCGAMTALFTERRTIASGERVGLRPQPDRLHVFDATSRVRLERAAR